MSANQLHQVALESRRFLTVTARRLRNIVVECFAPRYLVSGGTPTAHLKRLSATISFEHEIGGLGAVVSLFTTIEAAGRPATASRPKQQNQGTRDVA